MTSDSIAAHVVLMLGAEELMLLKSTLPQQTSASASDLVAQGVVDDYFPTAARSFLTGARVRLINLRDAQFAEVAVHDVPVAAR